MSIQRRSNEDRVKNAQASELALILTCFVSGLPLLRMM